VSAKLVNFFVVIYIYRVQTLYYFDRKFYIKNITFGHDNNLVIISKIIMQLVISELIMTFLCSRFRLRIPSYLLMPITCLIDWSYKYILSRCGMRKPSVLTSTSIKYATLNRTFNCNSAAEQLGYKPIVSLKVVSSPHFSLIFYDLFLKIYKIMLTRFITFIVRTE
jgi:hypothetical protein